MLENSVEKKTRRRNPDRPYAFLLPYLLLFTIFIVIPVVTAMVLSLTNFNGLQMPKFIGLKNYVNLITNDDVFMQHVLPNTILFSLIVGPGGYILSFLLAWMLAQIPKVPRTVLALLIYSPSMTTGIAMTVVWTVIFSGDQTGYLNNILMQLGLIFSPIQWLQSPEYLMPIMIIVSLWSSMGLGFLAMLAGVLNIDPTLYEAAYVDGIRNKFQEIIYITIPSMRPQMVFGAVMAVVNTFQNAAIGVLLSGSNPTPNYAGQLLVNHIEDYGIIRYEMGYASAVSVVTLLLVYWISKLAWRIFGEND
ncbi:MAG TPA: sugar ABC transporter permease [Fervidobacterium sp.]|jgi:multiple sugar transport system permease protein|nr:sugar ABC transporter permease [Fervidobacterium sp.]NLH37816.1 sugar ABC transporter permease [Thermotogaceae bacterium]MBP8657093.1 sugar ABC transporter permease [Fervidobacterium sp.]HOK33386.1 sugar ABC transporter permease [Fervidobacterium sp.]HOL03624.1 sugar ABC transporter permease [Fervidobacterium sp.]